jgi:hypothetical protein
MVLAFSDSVMAYEKMALPHSFAISDFFCIFEQFLAITTTI